EHAGNGASHHERVLPLIHHTRASCEYGGTAVLYERQERHRVCLLRAAKPWPGFAAFLSPMCPSSLALRRACSQSPTDINHDRMAACHAPRVGKGQAPNGPFPLRFCRTRRVWGPPLSSSSGLPRTGSWWVFLLIRCEQTVSTALRMGWRSAGLARRKDLRA